MSFIRKSIALEHNWKHSLINKELTGRQVRHVPLYACLCMRACICVCTRACVVCTCLRVYVCVCVEPIPYIPHIVNMPTCIICLKLPNCYRVLFTRCVATETVRLTNEPDSHTSETAVKEREWCKYT
jgi:hypothetical protein